MKAEDKERIDRIADSLREQFNDQISNPVMISTTISYEDQEFIYELRNEIYQRSEYDDNCAIVLTHMMVNLAFEQYDEKGFWAHFEDYFDTGTRRYKNFNERIAEILLEHAGYNVIRGNCDNILLVKSILFNAGIPRVQANVFFDTIYNAIFKNHSGMIADNIDSIVDDINKYYVGHNYSTVGFVTVRDFLSDREYSERICKDVLEKMDQVFNRRDESLTIDLGLLEEPFNQWYSNDRLIRKQAGSSKYGLSIDDGDYGLNYVIPQLDCDDKPYHIEIDPQPEEEFEGTIRTVLTQNGWKTVKTKVYLGDYPILEGTRITHGDKVLFQLEGSKYLVFDKDGFMRKQLSRGINTILGPYELSENTDLPISQILAERDNYCVYRTFDLSIGDVYDLDGELVTVGSSTNEGVKVEAKKINYRITVNNRLVNAFYNHPKITICSESKYVIMDLYRNGNRIFNRTDKNETTTTIDLSSIPGLASKNGLYAIKLRSGSKVFNYEYLCINDFDVSFDEQDSNGGKFTIIIDGTKKEFEYNRTDKQLNCTAGYFFGERIDVVITTPILAFQLKPSEDVWYYPSENNDLYGHDINRSMIVSEGFEDNGLCSLQFISDGKKIIGDEYARSHNGTCFFRIHHVVIIQTFKKKIEVFFNNGNGERLLLATLNDAPDVEVDGRVAGICVFTLLNRKNESNVVLRATADGKRRTVTLQYECPMVISYLYWMEYEIVEETEGGPNMIKNGVIKTNLSLEKKRKKYTDEELERDVALGVPEALFVNAKRLMNQRNYKDGIAYLEKASESGFQPAILELIYVNLYYDNKNCADTIYPLFKKLNMDDKINSLLYDIEKISRPRLKELDGDQDSS